MARGIVTSAGGDVYQANAYVMIRLLRQHGCTLPIECWYDGDRERDLRWQTLVEPLGVTCVDATARGFVAPVVPDGLTFLARTRKYKPGSAVAYARKVFAIANSGFDELLWLDADNCPMVDPSSWFDEPSYRAAGSMLWPDPPGGYSPNLAGFGLGGSFGPGLEMGQALFDRHRCRKALEMALWYCARSSYFFQHAWGDPDTALAAWLITGAPLNMATEAYSDDVAIHQHAPNGRLALSHRVGGNKWRVEGHNRPDALFPFHEQAMGYLREYREVMSPKWLVIVTRPRCGTHMLRTGLDSVPGVVSIGSEPFNVTVPTGLLWDGVMPVADWLRRNLPASARWGVVVLHDGQRDARPEVAAELRRIASATVILSRGDTDAQLRSIRAATAMGLWGCMPGSPRPDTGVSITPAECAAWANETAASVNADRSRWADVPHIELTYEQLCADWAGSMAKISALTGVDFSAAKPATTKNPPIQ